MLRFLDPNNYYLLYRQMGGIEPAPHLEDHERDRDHPGQCRHTPACSSTRSSGSAADATGNKLTLKLCAATDTSTGTTCSKVAQTLTATDSMLAGGSVGVLIGTGTGSTQQYRVDKFAAQVQ